jgi:dihydroorotase
MQVENVGVVRWAVLVIPAAAIAVAAIWLICDYFLAGSNPRSIGMTGARAAAKGGFTTICVMPNTDPPTDLAARVTWLQGRAEGAACRVRVVAAGSVGRLGEHATDLRELAAAGIVGVSDDGAAIASDALVRELLTALEPLGLPLIEHAEDPSLAAGSLVRATATRLRLGLAPSTN